MTLPPDVYFRSQLGLLLWNPRGILNEKVVNKILAFIREEEAIKDPAFEHYFKLHALLTDHSPLQAKLFKEENAAAKWLNVSIESLRPPQTVR